MNNIIIKYLIGLCFIFISIISFSYADEYEFVPMTEPFPNFETYYRGNLGIINTTYKNIYLIIAYRYLSGLELGEEEISSILKDSSQENTDWLKKWVELRLQIQKKPLPMEITVHKSHNEYSNFENCNQNSFKNAYLTLQSRMKEYNKQYLQAWIDAQDTVFTNCNGGKNIPREIYTKREGKPFQDREYQIGAAYFYSGDYDKAYQQFKQIATDPEISPWKNIATYLSLRCQLRKASFLADEKVTERTALVNEVRSNLTAILKDNSYSEIHSMSRDLQDFLQSEYDPEARRLELAGILSREHSGKRTFTYLNDLLILISRMNYVDSEDNYKRIMTEISKNDMLDWIFTFKSDSPSAKKRAIAKWQASGSQVWLVAAISKIQKGDSEIKKVLKKSERVRRNSRAFQTVQFHKIRILGEIGETERAMKELEFLDSDPTITQATKNHYLSLRLKYARDIDEFLMAANKKPVRIKLDARRFILPQNETQFIFDSDAGKIFTEKIPISLALTSLENKKLPALMKKEIASMIWVKSVLLDKEEEADRSAQFLASQDELLKKIMMEYLNEKTFQEKKQIAIFIILRYPFFKPYLQMKKSRPGKENEIDGLRDNWWCNLDLKQESLTPQFDYFRIYSTQDKTYLQLYKNSEISSPSFLEKKDRDAAEKEWNRLKDIGTAPNYLTGRVMEWANLSPEDPRLAEALHRTVKSTRFGCADKSTSTYSKSAFELLHRKFPKSNWAKDTKFWY